MPPIDESAKSLYTRFNASQLRELALASRLSSEAVSRLRSKEEAISAIDAISDRNRLALLSHRVETLSPYKHCVLLESPEKFSYGQISTACKRAFGALLSSFIPLESDERDLHLQLCIDDSVSERVFIKFAHMVEVWETMPSADKQQLKIVAPQRHVMVAEFNPAQQLISISFPGFTQAVVGKDRVTYFTFAAQVVEILEKKLSLKLEAFKLKVVTDFMLDDKEQEVVDLRRTLRFKRGGKMDLDSESDEDAAGLPDVLCQLDS